MKTLAEINDALKTAGIDPADLTVIIADIKAAVRESDAGVIADKQSAIEALTNELAKNREEAAAALTAANEKAASDLAAAQEAAKKEADALRVTYIADLERLDSEKAALKQDNQDLSDMSNSLIAKANSERDAALNQLDAFFAKQVEDVNKGLEVFVKLAGTLSSLPSAFDELKGVLTAAVTPIAERQAAAEKEANEKRKAELKAQYDSIP